MRTDVKIEVVENGFTVIVPAPRSEYELQTYIASTPEEALELAQPYLKSFMPKVK